MSDDTKDAVVDPDLINPDPFCPVRLTPIRNRGRVTDKYMIELQRPDSSEWADIAGVRAVHTANYRLVTNQQVHTMAAGVMAQTGLTFEPVPTWGNGQSKSLLWNGRHYLERWYTPDVKVATPHGSEIMLGLEVRNSYDGACKVGLAFFAMHCACGNQFYGDNILGQPYNFSHIGQSGELNGDIAGALNELQGKAEAFGRIVPTIRALTEARFGSIEDFLNLRRRLTTTTGLEFRDRQILDELDGRGVTSKLGIAVGKSYGSPDSLWALANAFTAVTTHAVGGLRGQDQSGRAVDFLVSEAKKRIAA
jgi:hypothetical protein